MGELIPVRGAIAERVRILASDLGSGGIDVVATAASVPDPRWDPRAVIRQMGIREMYDAWGTETCTGVQVVWVERGAWSQVSRALVRAGYRPRLRDDRAAPTAPWPPYRGEPLRLEQTAAVETLYRAGSGIAVLPTGAGKTRTWLALAARHGLMALIIVPRENLAEQWVAEARHCYGIEPEDVGRIYGGRCTVGQVLTVAMPGSLVSRIGTMSREWGTVGFDEAQYAAAETFAAIARGLASKYRTGITADPRRQDLSDPEIWATLGPVVFRRGRADAEASRSVHRVGLRIVPYDSVLLLPSAVAARERALLLDPDRLALIDRVVKEAGPGTLVLTRTYTAAVELRSRWSGQGISTGLMVGRGNPGAVQEFASARAGLADGSVAVVVGTWNAVGVGTDVPALQNLVLVSPPGRGDRGDLAYNQNRGRVSRLAPGKTGATTYLVWDRGRVRGTASKLCDWGTGTAELLAVPWRSPTWTWTEVTSEELDG